MINFFAKKRTHPLHQVDLHSHLIPGVDDGVKTVEESLLILRQMEGMGFKKVITTPHIMSDVYPNKEEDLIEKKKHLTKEIERVGLGITLELAAEYYVDDGFLAKLSGDTELLCFGEKNVLIETAFMHEPRLLHECIFKLVTKGYQPVFAHPERYMYIQEEYAKLFDLKERGVKFQVNLAALIGQYSKKAQKIVLKMHKDGLIHFVGSDCHNEKHLALLSKVWAKKHYAKIMEGNILNDSL